ncbi:MAG: hypothetical protein ABSG53_06295 [Thermoguttaceae bacterium]
MRANRLLMAMSAAAFLVAWVSYGRANDPARAAAIDVSLVSPHDFAAIVTRPRRIAQSPLVAKQLKDESIAGAIKKFGIDPSEVEQIVVLFGPDEKHPGRRAWIRVMITRFTHDVDAKEVLTKSQAAAGQHVPAAIEESDVGGKTRL